MKIKYEIDDSLQEDEIIIKTKQLSDKILELDRLLSSDTVDTVIGINDKKYFPIKTGFIERIFSENRKVFIYSKSELYETKKTIKQNHKSQRPKGMCPKKTEVAQQSHKSANTYQQNTFIVLVSQTPPNKWRYHFCDHQKRH